MLLDIEFQDGLVVSIGDIDGDCYEIDALTYNDNPDWKIKRSLMVQFRKTEFCSDNDSIIKKQDEDRVVITLQIPPTYTRYFYYFRFFGYNFW